MTFTLLRFRSLTLLALLSLVGSRGCEKVGLESPRPQSLPTTQMAIGNQKLTIEIASTKSQQETGLMYRDSMPADHGMIFAFPDARERGFWMRNTRIPLDILYLAPDGRVISIKHMKPHDLTSVSSDGAAQYAIELNVNAAASAGVKVGDKIEIPPGVKSAD